MKCECRQVFKFFFKRQFVHLEIKRLIKLLWGKELEKLMPMKHLAGFLVHN